MPTTAINPGPLCSRKKHSLSKVEAALPPHKRCFCQEVFSASPASHSFPYVKKRILVVFHKDEELSPIEVAIDEMRARVSELEDVVGQRTPDVKRLQLKLQGSVSAQVRTDSCAQPLFLHPGFGLHPHSTIPCHL